MFFSRRIGLNGGQPVPIRAGGRVTGRAGRYSLGALNIQTGESEDGRAAATNFSVVRVRRDVLKRSSIGVLATNRDVSAARAAVQPGRGRRCRLRVSLHVDDGRRLRPQCLVTGAGDGTSYWGKVDYNADRYGVQYDTCSSDPGSIRTWGSSAGSTSAAISRKCDSVRARPRQLRQLHNEVSLDYVTDPAGALETRVLEVRFARDFTRGDRFEVKYLRDFESLSRPVSGGATGVTIPVGGYTFQEVQAHSTSGRSGRCPVGRPDARAILRRAPHRRHLQRPCPAERLLHVRARAVGQRGGPALRLVHRHGGTHPRHLRALTAVVRRRARAVQLGHARRDGQRALALGGTGPDWMSSWSSAKGATPTPEGHRRCRAVASW